MGHSLEPRAWVRWIVVGRGSLGSREWQAKSTGCANKNGGPAAWERAVLGPVGRGAGHLDLWILREERVVLAPPPPPPSLVPRAGTVSL